MLAIKLLLVPLFLLLLTLAADATLPPYVTMISEEFRWLPGFRY